MSHAQITDFELVFIFYVTACSLAKDVFFFYIPISFLIEENDFFLYNYMLIILPIEICVGGMFGTAQTGEIELMISHTAYVSRDC